MKHQITTRQIESQITKLQSAVRLLHPHTSIDEVDEAEHSIKVAETIIVSVIEFLKTREGR